ERRPRSPHTDLHAGTRLPPELGGGGGRSRNPQSAIGNRAARPLHHRRVSADGRRRRRLHGHPRRAPTGGGRAGGRRDGARRGGGQRTGRVARGTGLGTQFLGRDRSRHRGRTPQPDPHPVPGGCVWRAGAAAPFSLAAPDAAVAELPRLWSNSGHSTAQAGLHHLPRPP
ncbi:MAG: hypothetical protein AVDCRST_MAG88-4710, partial [uncultured Thermomicrobiales bacterium]